LCLNFIPEAKGKISAVLQGSRLIFSALSLQLAGFFYQGTFQNIGWIISGFIIIGIITQWYVMKNRHLMEQLEVK
jgi:DHA1 family bicyclomycin/chloramphenicol resistance-like MFS transporter